MLGVRVISGLGGNWGALRAQEQGNKQHQRSFLQEQGPWGCHGPSHPPDAHTLPDGSILKTRRLRPVGTRDFAKLHRRGGLEEVVNSGPFDLKLHVPPVAMKDRAVRLDSWRCELG